MESAGMSYMMGNGFTPDWTGAAIAGRSGFMEGEGNRYKDIPVVPLRRP